MINRKGALHRGCAEHRVYGPRIMAVRGQKKEIGEQMKDVVKPARNMRFFRACGGSAYPEAPVALVLLQGSVLWCGMP